MVAGNCKSFTKQNTLLGRKLHQRQLKLALVDRIDVKLSFTLVPGVRPVDLDLTHPHRCPEFREGNRACNYGRLLNILDQHVGQRWQSERMIRKSLGQLSQPAHLRTGLKYTGNSGLCHRKYAFCLSIQVSLSSAASISKFHRIRARMTFISLKAKLSRVSVASGIADSRQRQLTCDRYSPEARRRMAGEPSCYR